MTNPALLFAAFNGTLAGQDAAGAVSFTGSGAVRYQAARLAQINYVPNPQFASNTTGWVAQGSATLSRITNDGPLGVTSVEVVSSTAGAGLSSVVGGSARVGGPGTYTLSFYAKSVSGAVDFTMSAIEQWADATNIGSNNSPTTITLTAAWARYTYTITTIRTGTHYLQLQVTRTTSVAATARFSAFQCESGSSATPSFDGSIGAWIDPVTGILGTAHASPSVSQAGVWLEEGATNTVPDPDFVAATITTNWTAAGSATIAKVTTHAYLGSNSGKVSCTASTSDGIDQLSTSGAAAANGQAWTVSGRLRAFAAGDVGKTVKPQIVERASDNSVVATNLGSAITLTDAWQAFAFTVTLAGGGTVAKVTCGFRAGAATAVSYVLDAINLAQHVAATSPVNGAIGTGYSWAGTANASASTRAATTVKLDETGRIDPLVGSIALRVRRTSALTGGTQTLLDVGDGTSGKDRLTLRVNSGNNVEMVWTSNGAAPTIVEASPTVAVNADVLVVAEWNGAATALSIDGGARATGVRDAPQGTLATANDLAIGSTNTGTLQANAVLGPLLVTNRILTALEVAHLAARTAPWHGGMFATLDASFVGSGAASPDLAPRSYVLDGAVAGAGALAANGLTFTHALAAAFVGQGALAVPVIRLLRPPPTLTSTRRPAPAVLTSTRRS